MTGAQSEVRHLDAFVRGAAGGDGENHEIPNESAAESPFRHRVLPARGHAQ